MGKRVSEDRKLEAARMVLEGGLSVNAVAKQLGLGYSTVEKAVAQQRSLKPDELTITEREELKKLRREVAELRMERDILKKATAYFAKVHA